VCEKILNILNKPASLIDLVADRPAHDRRYAIDYGKINSELGWKPATSFDEGLQHTIEWYLSNNAWWESIKSGAYLEFYKTNYADRGAAA
jgi:dTDP-glucose 4,6-dehydratase